ncbi:hypothetical protein ACLB2K_049360 [Fragaria x ananassa]
MQELSSSSPNLSIKEWTASEGRLGVPAFDPPMPKPVLGESVRANWRDSRGVAGRCWASKSSLVGETLAALLGESVRATWRDSRGVVGRCWASKSALVGETLSAWWAAVGRVSPR